jgi:hypothetical protein
VSRTASISWRQDAARWLSREGRAAVHPQSGKAMTAASSAKAPASITASGKTVLVIAHSARGS